MNKLEARILKLEEAGKRAAECTVVRIVSYAQGELTGFKVNGETTVKREPGESEDSLAKRAIQGLAGLITLHEIRKGDDVPYKLPYEPSVPTVAGGTESKPEEPKPEAPRAIPKPAPKGEIIILGPVERQHGHGSPWGFMA